MGIRVGSRSGPPEVTPSWNTFRPVMQDGVLSKLATRVLASIESFSTTNPASAANMAALQRIGSFVSPVGVDLAESLRTTAHAAPWNPHASTPGDAIAASRPSAAAATAAAVVDSSGDEVGERTLRAGANACAAPVIGASSAQTATEAANAPASGGGAAAEALSGVGCAGPLARLRDGAGSGKHGPYRSGLAPAGDSSTSAAATASDSMGGGSPGGAKLAAAPVLDSSEGSDARNSSISTTAADSVGANTGDGLTQKATTRKEHKTGFLLQMLRRLPPIRALSKSGSVGKPPGAGAPDADVQQVGQSDMDLRHKQVLNPAAPFHAGHRRPWGPPVTGKSSGLHCALTETVEILRNRDCKAPSCKILANFQYCRTTSPQLHGFNAMESLNSNCFRHWLLRNGSSAKPNEEFRFGSCPTSSKTTCMVPTRGTAGCIFGLHGLLWLAGVGLHGCLRLTGVGLPSSCWLFLTMW